MGMDINMIPMMDISAVQVCRNMDSIDNNFAIFNDITEIPLMEYPARVDVAVLAICLSGNCRVGINLEDYMLSTRQMLVILPDQIVQCQSISSDFSGAFVVFTKAFMDTILPRLKEILPLFLYLKGHPCIDLTQEEIDDMVECHSFLWKKVKMTNNLFRKEIAQGLLMSLFYDLYNICAPNINLVDNAPNRQQEIFERFLAEVTSSYKSERSVTYYAKKLFLTPKHLSWVVKEASGKTAGEWIDDFVILEAKALLKSSDMNIQQIAEDLHFANQSFFGKYFKHYTGMSPKQYRRI